MERKRFLAVVMTVMMVISMIPSMVFAAARSGELGGKLKIKGLAAVGVVLSADYAKVTPEEVTDEDFTFSWSRQTGEKELTQVGTEKTYTITQDDLGCRLVLDLTPVDGSGLTGTLTAKTLEVAATEEEAKAVEQEAEDAQQTETADGTENAQLEETADGTEDAQLEETADNAEGSQDSENQDVDRTEDVQQNAGNEQEDESQHGTVHHRLLSVMMQQRTCDGQDNIQCNNCLNAWQNNIFKLLEFICAIQFSRLIKRTVY